MQLVPYCMVGLTGRLVLASTLAVHPLRLLGSTVYSTAWLWQLVSLESYCSSRFFGPAVGERVGSPSTADLALASELAKGECLLHLLLHLLSSFLFEPPC